MSQKNIRRLLLRSFLCFASLPLLLSVFTSKASLQNANANVSVRAVVTATPRRSPRRSASPVSNMSRTEYTPEPTPTPLPANSTLRGRVFYADTGRAVKRASIMLMPGDGSGGPGNSPSALTDGSGNFEMKRVRAGTFYAVVNAPGVVSPLAFANFSKKNDREALRDAFAGFAKIIVDGVTDLDVQVPAYRGGAIGGRVMYDDGDPAIGVRVEILRKVDDIFVVVIPNLSVISTMMSGQNMFLTDDRGVYRFPGLPPGDYIIKVTESTTHGDNVVKTYYDPFADSMGSNSFLTVFFPDVPDTNGAQLIGVQLGQEIGEINLTLPSRRLFKLEGKIIDLKDKSPVKARVTIKRDAREDVYSLFTNMGGRQQPNSSLTDESGNWKFKELPKGTYRILVEPIETESEYRTALGDYSNMNAISRAERNSPPKPKLAKKVQDVTIDDKDLSELVIEVGYGATVSGSARVENSEEMPRSVSVVAAGENKDTAVSAGIANFQEEDDAEGKSPGIKRQFKLENVSEGKNYLTVFVEDQNYYVKSVTLNGTDLLANPLVVKEGEDLRNVQIVLAKDTGTLKGMILDDEKQPVKNMDFSLIPTDAAKRKQTGLYRSARSDENGEFEIKAAPGEYAFVFFDQSMTLKNREEVLKWVDQALKDAQTVRIEAGKTETVTIRKK